MTRQANDANAGAQTAGILGEIEVGRGRLDAAVAHYEEAARLLETQPPPAAFDALWPAAQIYFEQRQPEAALALGRRHPGPWASGVRGTAYLLLKNEPAAEKEFNALRAYLTPPLGEYMAGKYVDLVRLLAAAYAGRSQEVTAGWQQLGGQFRPAIALEVGRAYLELGDAAGGRATPAVCVEGIPRLGARHSPILATGTPQNDILSQSLFPAWSGRAGRGDSGKSPRLSRTAIQTLDESERRIPALAGMTAFRVRVPGIVIPAKAGIHFSCLNRSFFAFSA